MAIQTQGFRPTVLPGIEYADPRLFSPGYEKIIPQALGTAGGLMEIIENARMAPTRRRLAEIELQSAPARSRLAQIQAARAAQSIETIVGEEIVEVPRKTNIAPEDTPADYTPPVDVVSFQNVRIVDPITGMVREERRQGKPLASAENIANQESLIKAREEAAELKRQAAEIRAQIDREKIASSVEIAKLRQASGQRPIRFVTPDNKVGIRWYQGDQLVSEEVINESVARDPNIIALMLGLSNQNAPARQTQAPAPTMESSFNVPTHKPPVQEQSTLIVGEVYEDGSGGKATYLGNGRWQEL